MILGLFALIILISIGFLSSITTFRKKATQKGMRCPSALYTPKLGKLLLPIVCLASETRISPSAPLFHLRTQLHSPEKETEVLHSLSLSEAAQGLLFKRQWARKRCCKILAFALASQLPSFYFFLLSAVSSAQPGSWKYFCGPQTAKHFIIMNNDLLKILHKESNPYISTTSLFGYPKNAVFLQ